MLHSTEAVLAKERGGNFEIVSRLILSRPPVAVGRQGRIEERNWVAGALPAIPVRRGRAGASPHRTSKRAAGIAAEVAAVPETELPVRKSTPVLAWETNTAGSSNDGASFRLDPPGTQ